MNQEQKITMTLDQLRCLLDQQKDLTIAKLLSHSYVYNSETTPGEIKTLPIDKEKFVEHGMKASYPNDYNVLQKY